MNRLFGPTIPIITVVVLLVLALVIVGCYICWEHKYFPATSGGWGDPSLSGTVVMPQWIIGVGGWLLDKATSWLWDCTMGPTGQCTMANGPTGGGGGGGIPPQCSSGDFCSGGPMGPAAKKSLWNWFAFSEQPN